MAALRLIESHPMSRLWALDVVDGLARALQSKDAAARPVGELWLDIIAAIAPVRRQFNPPLRLRTLRNRAGALLLDGTCARAGRPDLPLGEGTYRVQVRGLWYCASEFELRWPPPPATPHLPPGQEVVLLPGPSYGFPDGTLLRHQRGPTVLRGTAMEHDGTALQDARVAVHGLRLNPHPPRLPPLSDWPLLETRSDERGDWVLVLPDRGYLSFDPDVPAQPVRLPITVAIEHPRLRVHATREIELGGTRVFGTTALRGQVLRGGHPAEGVSITSSVDARAVRTGADGQWWLRFRLDQPELGQVKVKATAPDGAWAEASGVALRVGATVVVPAIRLPA